MIGQLRADSNTPFANQSPFALGQKLGQRLVKMREIGKSLQTSSSISDEGNWVKQAALGAASVKQWAGQLRVGIQPLGRQGPVESIHMVLAGLSGDTKEEDTATLQAQKYVAVFGPAWVADCATGKRTACPQNFFANYVQQGTILSAVDMTNNPTLQSDLGMDGNLVEMDFAVSGSAAPNFQPHYSGNSSQNEHLYVVKLFGSEENKSKGEVVAAFDLHTSEEVTWAEISKFKNNLEHGLAGISTSFADDECKKQGCEFRANTPSTSPKYCIEGVNRDDFITLENELTSISDNFENSWKHYLELAKESARYADDLAYRKLAAELDNVKRQEAAQNELAELCGSYTSAQSIKFDAKNDIVIDPTDPIAGCLSEDTMPIVYLTTMPKDGDKADYIRNLLSCDEPGVSNNPLCEKSDAELEANVGALGLIPSEPKPDKGGPCLTAWKPNAQLSSTTFDVKKFQDMLFDPRLTSERIFAASSQIRMKVRGYGDWSLYSGAKELMDSRASSKLFPGCLRAGGDCKSDRYATLFSTDFRAPGALQLSYSPCDNGMVLIANTTPNVSMYSCTKPLGQVQSLTWGNGQGAAEAEDLEAMAILWRVEGAMWLMGSIANRIPAGMFEAPVPAANFSTPNVWNQDSAPSAAVYGNSYWVTANMVSEFSDPNQIEINQMKGAEPVGNYVWPNTPEIPTWVRQPYDKERTAPNSYLHLYRVNTADTAVTLRNLSNWDIYKAFRAGFPANVQNLVKYIPSAGLECPNKFYGGIGSSLAGGSDPSVAELSRYKVQPSDVYNCDHTGQCWPGNPEYSQCWNGTMVGTVNYNCAVESGTWGKGILPSQNTPASRIGVTINSYAKLDSCGVLAEFQEMTSLACAAQDRGLKTSIEAPEITNIGSLPLLHDWLSALPDQFRAELSKFALENLPTRTVIDLQAGKVGTGSKDGRYGKALLDLSKALEDLIRTWSGIEKELKLISSDLGILQSQLDIKGSEKTIGLAELTIKQLQNTAAIVHHFAEAAKGFLEGATNPVMKGISGSISGADSVAQIYFLSVQQSILSDIKNLIIDKFASEEALILQTFGKGMIEHTSNISGHLSELRKNVASIQSLTSDLTQIRKKARMTAALAAGKQSVIIDGHSIDIHVNQVTDKINEVENRRYLKALRRARTDAYVARLAVEQKLGKRLNTIQTPVGSLPPPAQWADDVCYFQGVDQIQLAKNAAEANAQEQTLNPNGTPGEPSTLSNIALFLPKDMLKYVVPTDGFIGDYVQQLQSFVEQYVVERPFHEGEDSIVVSLRDHIVAKTSSICTTTAPNLLLFSGKLNQRAGSVANGNVSGWQTSACTLTPDSCIEVFSGDSVAKPDSSILPPVAPNGSTEDISWIREVLAAEAVPYNTSTSASESLPTGISQVVTITQPGSYVLSWYDQARHRLTGDFLPPTDEVAPYRVSVRKLDGNLVYQESMTPFVSNATMAPNEAWSEQRQSRFAIQEPGSYVVTYHPTASPEVKGSVLIATTQLELLADANGSPQVYYSTWGTREVTTPCQSIPPSQFQEAFTRKQDPNGSWYYEFENSLSLDTSLIFSNIDYMHNVFARGNYNFRHQTLALNMVGTGLLDCKDNPTQTCYGTGTIHYTLEHDARDVPIISGITSQGIEGQCFNFGTAGIFFGQALAAEKVITSPNGSADKGLLSQPGIEKNEFMGRPLSGTYRLKIWETPELTWDKLEDIQLVLKYRYWSPVKK
jgi:hypothetical protein